MTAIPAEADDGAVVDLLTRIALLTTSEGYSVDFAAYLANTLASVTANVGSLDRLLAGRSGSWEASLVAQLVQGTVGFDPDALWRHRTAPIVVNVHVAHLVESLNGNPGIDKARDQLDAKYYAMGDVDQDAFYAENDALHTRWRNAYQAYGEAVREAVIAQAATVPGLAAPVTVEVIDDPDDRWWQPDARLNPSEDGDELAWVLWDHATGLVPLPVDEHGNLTGSGTGETQ